MSDIKLFRNQGGTITELPGTTTSVEKSLQTLFEQNLSAMLGVRFVASEFSTTHGGRMDTLGLDENGSPVIIEYKRTTSENVINQGLFYLDWLMDHRGDFALLVQKVLGSDAAQGIDWASPRLICIAADFTKYDVHAIKQMGRNIELVRYKVFDDDLLALELLTAVSTAPKMPPLLTVAQNKGYDVKTVSEILKDASQTLSDLFADIEAQLLALGDEVIKRVQQNYFAYRRIKNFACVEVKPTLELVRVYLKVSPDEIPLEEGFTRDVRKIGHYGTGDLEVTIRDHQDLEKAIPLFQRSFDVS